MKTMERKILIAICCAAMGLILYTHRSTVRVSREELRTFSDQQLTVLGQAGSIQRRVDGMHQKREDLQKALAALRSALQGLQNQIDTLTREIQALDEDVKSLESGLQRSSRSISQIAETPGWNLYSPETAAVVLIFLSILWLLYFWYRDRRARVVGSAGRKRELKVVEGGKEQPAASSSRSGPPSTE